MDTKADRGNAPLERVLQAGRAVAGYSVAGPLGALLLAMVFFTFESDQFLKGPNL